MGMDLLVYVLPEGKEELALSYFSKEYGVFEYSHLERKTYIQSFAQKARLREKNGIPSSRSHSTLYERLVLPFITKDMHVLDFGAGQKDYATRLKKEGYLIDAIEFFHRKDGADVIDEKEIRQDCADVCRTLSEYGLYDVVVCDSVLNSVNSLDDERNVLLSISALCKPGGMIFWSGIPLLFAQKASERKETHDYRSRALFLDANNFTANFRFGEWYFQHYHSTADVCRLTEELIGSEFRIYEKGKDERSKFIRFQRKESDTEHLPQSGYADMCLVGTAVQCPGRRTGKHGRVMPVHGFALRTITLLFYRRAGQCHSAVCIPQP